MRADSIATSNIKNRIGSKGSLEKVADVRLLLEEKRQNNIGPRQPNSTVKSGNFKTLILCRVVGGSLKWLYSFHICAPLQPANLREFCSAALSTSIQLIFPHEEAELGIALGKNGIYLS